MVGSTSETRDSSLSVRYLGQTQHELFPIGQGTTQTGGYGHATADEDRRRAEVLRFGVDLGMSLIDTAELYGGGHAEEIVGQAIEGIRDKVVLASKFNPDRHRYQDVILAAEQSLKRLQTDYLDIYQIHWPNPVVPIDETVSAIESLIQDGKVRFVGVSNFTASEVMAARAACASAEALVSVQIEYNLFQRSAERETLPYCQREGVTPLAYSPLDRGSSIPRGNRRRLLHDLAKKYEKSVTQIILRWLLARPSVIPIVKSASKEHTLENAEAVELDLADEEIDEIDRAFRQRIVSIHPSRIRVGDQSATAIYSSVDEAVRNKGDLVPAPEMVARNILEGNYTKPIPVARSRKPSNQYDYELLGDEILYWAWVIAKGAHCPITAYIKQGGPIDT